VQRIWRAHKLQPRRLRTFKRSRDPSFTAKLTDIVGLYVDPPAHAVVLSRGEKSQIQVLDRTQPGLPIKPGRCQTMTHDYERHSTTTLFAALSVLDGKVIDRCMQRHRHIEFIRFLNAVEREVPAGKLIHTVLDNYATHKHPKVLAWLGRHPRWSFHFTPTSASWLNAVENFFSKMTRQRIRRGVFRSITDLQAAINAHLAEHNASPKPFVRTQSADAILGKLNRLPVTSVRLSALVGPGAPRAPRTVVTPARAGARILEFDFVGSSPTPLRGRGSCRYFIRVVPASMSIVTVSWPVSVWQSG
jgi:transposase